MSEYYSETIEERILRILSSMSLEEKIAQLMAVSVDSLLDDHNRFSREKAVKIIGRGIGQIARVAGSRRRLSPSEVVSIINEIQSFLIKETRMRIPAIVHEECLAGLMGRGATSFPHPIGLASTWDPDLVERVASAIRREALAVGARQCLSPVLDLSIDPRWGRVEETFGEDPYLASVIGLSYIKGLHSEDLSRGVLATPKHFVAHSMSEGGRNIAPVNIGFRMLREVFMAPFEVAVKIGGALSLMAAYHDIDGVPCHFNRELLTDILRGEWGFRGFVVSDYGGVRMLMTLHKVARDCVEAASEALKAGVDIELPDPECFSELVEAVRRGLVSEALIDEAVRRVLRVKILLGLFENPFVDERNLKILRDESHIDLAREAARASIVLLKNDNVLPIPNWVRKIAVIGPNADNPLALFGDYSPQIHIKALDQKSVTVLQALRSREKDRLKIMYAPGCRDVRCETSDMFSEAVRIADDSDMTILVLGEVSGLFGEGLSGEGSDRARISLPGLQEELALEICDRALTTIVLFNGRPLDLKKISERCGSILEAWYPGEEGANALTEILFGEHDPGGRLPISFPKDVSQIPVYYYRRESSKKDYVDLDSNPLYPFGHGLSYTRFEYENLTINPSSLRPGDDVEISFEVLNIGERSGHDVAQVYIKDLFASVSRPSKELKGFAKIFLRPGEKAKVFIKINTHQLAFYNRSMRLTLEPGTFEVFVGRSSEDIRLKGSFELIEGSLVNMRRRYISEARVVYL